MNKRLLAAGVTGSLGGLVFGYDLGALSSATQSLRGNLNLSPASFGLTISSSLWGTVFGSMLAGRVADRVGRRNLIAGCALVYAVSAIGITIPVRSEWTFICAMRLLCGIAIGGFTVACPLYLSEVAPVGLRGRLVSMFQIQVGLGVVVAFLAGLLVNDFTAKDVVWRWCLGLGALPAVVQLLFLLLMPGEEPRTVRRANTMPMSHIRHGTDGPGTAGPGVAGHDRLFSRRNSRPILLATSIALFNQLSGVNILLLYMLDVFSSAGIGFVTGHRYTVIISSLSLATTLLGMILVDKAGRKPLLIIGSVGMAMCLVCLAIAIPHHLGSAVYLSILVAYNAFFAVSQGTVIWVYLSEIFPPGVRGAGQGYGAAVHWIANALLVSLFPIIQHASPVRMFYLFGLMMAAQTGVIWRFYPETRGTNLGALALT